MRNCILTGEAKAEAKYQLQSHLCSEPTFHISCVFWIGRLAFPCLASPLALLEIRTLGGEKNHRVMRAFESLAFANHSRGHDW